MKKVLYITTHLNQTDGYGRYGHNVVSAANHRGFETVCVVAEKSFAPITREHTILESTYRYWTNIYVIARTALRLNNIIAQYRPDVIHIMAEPYAATLPFLRTHDARIVLSTYGTFVYIPLRVKGFFLKKISEWLTYAYYQKVDTVIVVSSFTKNQLLKWMPAIEKKVSVVLPGIFFTPQGGIQKKSTKNNVLFVGAVKERKGVLQALQGVAMYRKMYGTNIHYTIVGTYTYEDRYYQKLKAYIQEHNLEECVTFAGQVSEKELHMCYAQADVFLMTSIVVKGMFEGFGLVYLEANMYRVPTIGSVESGAIDAIVDGVTGFLVDPYDPEIIAEKLHRVLDEKDIAATDCIEWAKKNTVENMTRTLFSLYE